MKAIRGIKAALLALLVVLVAGCAASQKMSSEDRGKVTSAKFGEPEKGQLFLLAPSGANIGLMFGAVGGLAASGKIEDNKKVFSDFLDKNGISVEKIVREEVEAAIRASGKLAVANTDDAAAPTLKISILQYGFGVPHLLSKNVVPIMYLKCDLVDAKGRLVWSANDRMLPSIASKAEPTSWEAMRDDPKKIEEEWRKAAQMIAKNIVNEL